MIKLFTVLLLFLVANSFAQVKSVGTPYISNYPKSEYGAGTQNWSIAQDKAGIMYFANNDGVLIFDGTHWEIIQISFSSPIRALGVDDDGVIYVGLLNNFGRIVNSPNGSKSFESLRHLIPQNSIDFGEIWKIHNMPYGIVFQSFSHVFIFDGEKINQILPKNKFHFSFKVGTRLFLHEPQNGLFELINGFVNKVPWDNTFTNMEIWTIMPYHENHLLIGTARNGLYKYEDGHLFKWESQPNELLIQNKLFCGVKISADIFAFGTILDGIIISNIDGKIIQHINKEKGLSNNTILSSFLDKNNNLWLGLDNGIDYVEINSPISLISDFENIGTGYCAKIFQGNLYLGTNRGLFVKPYNTYENNKASFELIRNTTGQVWNLEEIDGQLFCGHNLGTFLIEGKTAQQISKEPGAWNFIPLQSKPNFIIAGQYNGLTSFKKIGNKWEHQHLIKGYSESSRFIEEDRDGTLWISHGAKGVFNVALNEDLDAVIKVKLYNSNNGLPSNEQNIIMKVKNEIVVSTLQGFYSFNPDSDQFILNQHINTLFNEKGWIKTVEVDNSENIWFISSNESGVLRLNEDLNYTKITAPFLRLKNQLVNSFEFIYPFGNSDVYIGTDYGFAHYSSKMPKSYKQSFPTYISAVDIPYLDTTIVSGTSLNYTTGNTFPYKMNSFRFHFTAPFYENLEDLLFSYKMEGYEDSWSEWSSDIYKDFTNLDEGKYRFIVKAKNVYGTVSEPASFQFEVEPPWFRSLMAYMIYAVLIMLAIFLVAQFMIKRLERLKKQQKEKHLEELKKREEDFFHHQLIAEKEIVKLRNDKLRNEMIHRDKELANQTMNIVQKNKFLMKIKEELKRIQLETNDSGLKTNLSLVNSRIDKEIDNKHQKRVFETYFDETHETFFERLKQKFPQLTPKELRMCAYIRMNISTKEIATLSNISHRGVEVSRYRLRKKLDLNRDENLSTFLSNI